MHLLSTTFSHFPPCLVGCFLFSAVLFPIWVIFAFICFWVLQLPACISALQAFPFVGLLLLFLFGYHLISWFTVHEPTLFFLSNLSSCWASHISWYFHLLLQCLDTFSLLCTHLSLLGPCSFPFQNSSWVSSVFFWSLYLRRWRVLAFQGSSLKSPRHRLSVLWGVEYRKY